MDMYAQRLGLSTSTPAPELHDKGSLIAMTIIGAVVNILASLYFFKIYRRFKRFVDCSINSLFWYSVLCAFLDSFGRLVSASLTAEDRLHSGTYVCTVLSLWTGLSTASVAYLSLFFFSIGLVLRLGETASIKSLPFLHVTVIFSVGTPYLVSIFTAKFRIDTLPWCWLDPNQLMRFLCGYLWVVLGTFFGFMALALLINTRCTRDMDLSTPMKVFMWRFLYFLLWIALWSMVFFFRTWPLIHLPERAEAIITVLQICCFPALNVFLFLYAESVHNLVKGRPPDCSLAEAIISWSVVLESRWELRGASRRSLTGSTIHHDGTESQNSKFKAGSPSLKSQHLLNGSPIPPLEFVGSCPTGHTQLSHLPVVSDSPYPSNSTYGAITP